MSKLQSQVLEFMKLGGQTVEPVPTIPDRKTIALRVNLAIEEVLEFFEGCYGTMPEIMIVAEMIRNVTVVREPKPDLAKIADALGDTDYVIEGARLAFGIDGESVADAIHSSNLKKVEGKVAALASGKIGKPQQWQPPDIEGVLFKQNSGELPSVGDRLKKQKLLKAFYEVGEEMEGERAAAPTAGERWGVWVSGGCDRDSDDGWIYDGLFSDGSTKTRPWYGTEQDARARAETLSKQSGRERFKHEARPFVCTHCNGTGEALIDCPGSIEYQQYCTTHHVGPCPVCR